MTTHALFMQQAIKLAKDNVKNGGGPFGAIIAKNGKVVGTGVNNVTLTNDPTAHAEIVAIRDACAKLQVFSLEDCLIYSSCEPCPMCLSAIYWARISKLYYGATRFDADQAGFRDDFLYKELALPIDERAIPMAIIRHEQTLQPFALWEEVEEKILY